MLKVPKGPNPLPRFCTHCKIYGHSDLTCHLQGNAPTPGPSNFQKPFKYVQQRTPRRGLGAPRRTKALEGQQKKGEIIFRKEAEPEKGELGTAGAGEVTEGVVAQEGSAPGGKESSESLKIHLTGCRAPPTATQKGKEKEWKRVYRNTIETA